MQLKVTKQLFKMIPAHLEECLKYVLLLNFDEEPKYDYLIDELKRAYVSAMQETNEKVSLTSAFRNPVFDWNVSLATRFQKIQSVIDDHWKEGETIVQS